MKYTQTSEFRSVFGRDDKNADYEKVEDCFPCSLNMENYEFRRQYSFDKRRKKNTLIVRDSQPEVFYRKNCSKTFRNIHREALVLEFLFNRVS